MFKPKDGPAWQPHPILAAIQNDDPELAVVLAGIKTPVVSISQMIAGGPHGRTVLYDGINNGLLKTWVSMGKRNAFAHDYAKYLLALKRLDELKQATRPRKLRPAVRDHLTAI
jgi:hypothetical protein